MSGKDERAPAELDPGWKSRAVQGSDLERVGIEEVCALTGGVDMWHTTPVESVGLPSVRMTDGPNGARGEIFGTSRSTCFPCGAGQAATWDIDLVYRIGKALAIEAKSKLAGVLLAPTVNIQRSPLAGRNFECFSEDPYLTAVMAVAFVEGVQSEGVAACIKHFVCNEYETNRMTASSVVDERTLREIYLLPFEAAVKTARVQAVMAAYNRLNGVFCSEHRRLLTNILRDEWGFDGVVISDWGAVHNGPAAVKAGLDLEMPGPPRHMGPHLAASVQNGSVPESVVRQAATRVARMVRSIQLSGAPVAKPGDPEGSEDSPAHRKLAREAAAKSLVLLKNEGVLPLDLANLRRLAVIGAYAEKPAIQGGGSAQVRPHAVSTPLEAITERARALGVDSTGGIEIRYARAWEPKSQIPSADPSFFKPLDEVGSRFVVEYFEDAQLSGNPVRSEAAQHASIAWAGLPEGFSLDRPFGARWRGTLQVPSSGEYVFAVAASGRSKVLLEGVEIVDNWTAPVPGGSMFGATTRERRSVVVLEAGREYSVNVEFTRDPTFEQSLPTQTPVTLVHFGLEKAERHPGLGEAVELAAWADVALVFCGTGPEWESEGFDKESMALPGDQDELIKAVAAANPRCIVVANCGSAVEMPWIERVAAALMALFPGEEFGNALADVIFGNATPGGKLPFSIPKRIEDCAVYPGLRPEGENVFYTDRVFTGYRYFDTRKIEPLFCFGHGLSYGQIEIIDCKILQLTSGDSQSQRPLTASQKSAVDKSFPATGTYFGPQVAMVQATLENRGRRRGAEVLQVYVRDPQSSISRPEKELKGFVRIELDPGDAAQVQIPLESRDFSYFDTGARDFVAPSKHYEILLGFSSRDIRSRLVFRLE